MASLSAALISHEPPDAKLTPSLCCYILIIAKMTPSGDHIAQFPQFTPPAIP